MDRSTFSLAMPFIAFMMLTIIGAVLFFAGAFMTAEPGGLDKGQALMFIGGLVIGGGLIAYLTLAYRLILLTEAAFSKYLADKISNEEQR